MSILDSITHPLPLDPLPENKLEDRRLWIGNLDPRITEYNLLKLLQKYGPIEKFDLLFHRSGPLAGQPRGYAFVTYSNSDDANKAKEKLDGTMLGNKHVVVRWANSVGKDGLDKPKPELEIPALAGAKTEKKISRQTTIQAIEAKLKLMEHSTVDEFEINNPPSGSLHSQQRITLQRPTISRPKVKGRYESRPYKKSSNHKR